MTMNTDIILETRSGGVFRGGTYTLGICGHGGPSGCYPLRPYYIQLPSGMRFHHRTEKEARNSQDWPFK